jgi:hypothetical protein
MKNKQLETDQQSEARLVIYDQTCPACKVTGTALTDQTFSCLNPDCRVHSYITVVLTLAGGKLGGSSCVTPLG